MRARRRLTLERLAASGIEAHVVLHERGAAVGVQVGDVIHTHNMEIRPSERWSPVEVEAVPVKLQGYLDATLRRAWRNATASRSRSPLRQEGPHEHA